jgi:membrane-associated protease RseP (regulator of RpoE activity)
MKGLQIMNSSLTMLKTLISIIKGTVTLLIVLAAFFISTPIQHAKNRAINSSIVGQSDAPKSWIGIKGVMAFFVKSTQLNTPSQKAGFKLGDAVIGLNGEDVLSPDNFMSRIWQSDPGTSFQIKFLRFDPAKQEWAEHSTTLQTMAAQTSAALLKVQFLKAASSVQCDCPSGCCAQCSGASCAYACHFTGYGECVSNPCKLSGFCT